MGRLKNIKRDALGRIPQKWDCESALEESKKYNSKKEFRTKSNPAYQYLVKHKMLNRVMLPGKRHRLDTWEIFCSLKKSASWTEFREMFPKEYTAFHKRKSTIHETAFLHLGMSKTSKRWTKEAIKEEAKKYNHKSDFIRLSSGAYTAALNQKIIDEVCEHMISLQSDFDCVYMWVAKNEKHRSLVKFGVTSKRLGNTRINFVESKSGYKAISLTIADCSNALSVEKELKSIGVNAGLTGFSGSTEFYWLDKNQINEAKRIIEDETIK